MTTFNAYSIHDTKAQAFSHPVWQRTDASAIRAFADACKNPESVYGQHPEDYHLYRVGVFNEMVGELCGENPVHLIHGINTLEMETKE